MTRLAGRRCWIVGASSGIGAALARELVARDATVAISARREDALREVASGDVAVASDDMAVASDDMAVVPVDVTEPDAVEAARDQVHDALGGLDVVIFSAGYWHQFDARNWDREDFARHVEVNLLGLNNVLAAILPGMVGAGAGHVVGIASVAGYRGLPGAEAYGATKAAQLNLLEALRVSLGTTGVRVTTVSPGFVRTEMTDDNDFPMPFMVDADRAGRAIADGLEAGRTEITFPLPMAVLMKVANVVPVGLWAALGRRFSD